MPTQPRDGDRFEQWVSRIAEELMQSVDFRQTLDAINDIAVTLPSGEVRIVEAKLSHVDLPKIDLPDLSTWGGLADIAATFFIEATGEVDSGDSTPARPALISSRNAKMFLAINAYLLTLFQQHPSDVVRASAASLAILFTILLIEDIHGPRH